MFNRGDQTDDAAVGHGDWVVDTICSGLENPERDRHPLHRC